MHYTQFKDTYFIRLDPGEEIVSSLHSFCKQHSIKLGKITGLGATNQATIGLFDSSTKKYHTHDFKGDHEISLLYGNITTKNNEPYLHMHIVVCDAEHHAFGGHLSSAWVSVTFEGIIETYDGTVERVIDPQSGLNVLDI
jgi:predicted DNA-binding protein with PD1-like motif